MLRKQLKKRGNTLSPEWSRLSAWLLENVLAGCELSLVAFLASSDQVASQERLM